MMSDVSMDKMGIVRDVNVRTFPTYPVSTVKSIKESSTSKASGWKSPTKIPATLLHRDIRLLVVLVPVEEEFNTETMGKDHKKAENTASTSPKAS